jgi:hypothetical protein
MRRYRKAICRFCERRFRNCQSVRAHLRHCIVYQGHVQAAAKARHDLPRQTATKESALIAREGAHAGVVTYTPRRASRDSIVMLFDGWEELGELLRRTADRCHLSRLLGSVRDFPSQYEHWVKVLLDLHRMKKEYGDMVYRQELDHVTLVAHYHRLLELKDRWSGCFLKEALQCQDVQPDMHVSAATDDAVAVDSKAVALFTSLLAKLKRLVASSR